MTGEKSGEFRGKTVEAAISAGLAALRLAREQVEIEVVRPGSRGVLGIGAEDAVVRLTAARPGRVEPKATPRPEPQPEPEPEPAPSQPIQVARPELRPTPAPQPKLAPRQPQPQPAAPVEADDKVTAAAAKGKELLGEVLARMNLQAEVEIVPQSDAESDDDDERALVLNIVGGDLGVLIGRQNETLSALEFITRLMVNQQTRTRTSFVVDVNGYRAKRAESLRRLALRMAEQAEQAGRTMALEPMTPAERRIIHLALRNHPSVITQSVGEGDRRKVTIVPKKG